MLTLYRPNTSHVFKFIVFRAFFSDPSGFHDDYFFAMLALSSMQAILCAYYQHISFYSYKTKCWDAVGWWFHTIALLLNHIVIPWTALILAVHLFSNDIGGWRSPFGMITMNYAISTMLTGVKFLLFHAKHMIFDTYVYYKSRR